MNIIKTIIEWFESMNIEIVKINIVRINITELPSDFYED